MACYYPTPALHDPAAGTCDLWPPAGTANTELPCGTCLGCKTDRALDWARRAQHEASRWTYNVFLTLTYKPEDCPDGLVPEDLQAFIKRLRHHHRRNVLPCLRDAGSLRYLACGEYGDRGGRPHYHLCLFNCGFSDIHKVGKDLYESDLLNKLWPYGQHRLGTLTAASANYVAQYTLKKIGSTYADPDGVVKRAPFLRASLKPAIGATWLQTFHRDVINGFLVYDGTPGRVPRTYQKWLDKHYPQLAEASRHAAHELRRKAKERAASGGDAYPPAARAEHNEQPVLSHKRKQQQQRQLQADELAARREAAARIHASRNQHFNRRETLT